MNSAIGHSAVLLGLLSAIFGVITLAVGLFSGRASLLRSGRTYIWLLLAASVVAVVAMENALIGHDFSLEYVADNGSRSTPLLYTVASLWGALEGSILLWAFILSGYLSVMAWKFRHKATDPVVAWATLSGLAIAAFFFAVLIGPADPFQTVSGPVQSDGPGPNPLLQNHPLMAVHPPMLYLGYIGFTIPFVFSVAALIRGRVDENWLNQTRRWALFAWGFLTMGIVLGAWWSYEVLGWGGYWAWDPVENASFLPWLTATAFLHSAMVQNKRAMLRVWNLTLLLATFSLTILGTFLTRSGVLDSVHSFTESSIGPMFLGFLAFVLILGVGLIGWRGDQLRSTSTIRRPISREGFFLANNIAFAGFAFVVLLGTLFPLVVEALNGDRISVGRPYFDRMTMPIGFTLLFLMAVAPVLPWRQTSRELIIKRLQRAAWIATATVVVCVAFGIRGLAPLIAFGLGAFAAAVAVEQLVRGIRKNGPRALAGSSGGGMIVHLGLVVIAVAFAASQSFDKRQEFRLNPNETVDVAGHQFTYMGMKEVKHPNRTALEARVQVDGEGIYAPALNRFPFATQAVGTPSVRTGFTEDIYLTLISVPSDNPQSPVTIGIAVLPLVMWLWIGGGIMGLGTILAIAPFARRQRPKSRRTEVVPVQEPPLVTEVPVLQETRSGG